MPDLHCPICFDAVNDLTTFRTCGHCVCNPCAARLKADSRKEGKLKCPQCRKGMITTDLLRLFLPLSPADAVVDSISHLDKNSNPDALEAVANKMDKVADKLIGDEGGKNRILEAVEDFRSRITSQYELITQQAKELDNVRAIVRSSESRDKELSTQIKVLERENERLRTVESDTLSEAIQQASDAADQVLALRKGLKSTTFLLHTQTDQNKRLTTKVGELTATISTMKTKVNLLERQVEAAADQANSVQLVALDESLDFEEQHRRPRKRVKPLTSHNHNSTPDSVPEPLYEYEGMPRPGFSSSWAPAIALKKKPLSTVFPVKVDKRGHTKVAVQTGPRHGLRAPPSR